MTKKNLLEELKTGKENKTNSKQSLLLSRILESSGELSKFSMLVAVRKRARDVTGLVSGEDPPTTLLSTIYFVNVRLAKDKKPYKYT